MERRREGTLRQWWKWAGRPVVNLFFTFVDLLRVSCFHVCMSKHVPLDARYSVKVVPQVRPMSLVWARVIDQAQARDSETREGERKVKGCSRWHFCPPKVPHWWSFDCYGDHLNASTKVIMNVLTEEETQTFKVSYANEMTSPAANYYDELQCT